LSRISHDTINTNREPAHFNCFFSSQTAVSVGVRDETVSLFLRVGECDSHWGAICVIGPAAKSRERRASRLLLTDFVILDRWWRGNVSNREIQICREREITLIGLQARLSVVHVWRQSQQWLVFNSLCVWHTVAMSQMEKPREAIACSDDVSFDQYQCYRSSYFSQIIKNIAHVGYWTFFCFRAYIFRISFTMWAII